MVLVLALEPVRPLASAALSIALVKFPSVTERGLWIQILAAPVLEILELMSRSDATLPV